MDSYYDPLGFNKQTATLLRGLGAPELIPECKKRNISTDTLHQLSEQELIKLGASPEKAEKIRRTLCVKKRSGLVGTSVEDRVQHFLEIIKNGEQQLSLIQAYVAYCRFRLVEAKIDPVIAPHKYVHASEILPLSVRATLHEQQEAAKNLSELEELILRLTVKPKRNNTRRLCVFISGLGLVTLVLFKIYLK